MNNNDLIFSESHQHGDVLCIDLWYPDVPDEPGDAPRIRKFQIGLTDVRAADDIRVSYDKERDGWKIEQEEIETDGGAFRGTGDWKEVAFIAAWGREREIINVSLQEGRKGLKA